MCEVSWFICESHGWICPSPLVHVVDASTLYTGDADTSVYLILHNKTLSHGCNGRGGYILCNVRKIVFHIDSNPDLTSLMCGRRLKDLV